MRKTSHVQISVALIVAVAGAWLVWKQVLTHVPVVTRSPKSASVFEPVARSTANEPSVAASIVLPVYVPDIRRLPPVDTPVRDSCGTQSRRSFASRTIEYRRPALTAAQRLEADRLAEQLFNEHFAGRPTSARADAQQQHLMGPIYTGIGPVPPGREHECELAKEEESR